MPRECVWDYLIQPEFRNTLIGTDRMEITNRANGRIAPGSVYQCYHGDKSVPQTILKWQPFDSMIVKELFPMSHAVSTLVEYRLTSIEGETRLTRSMSKPTGPFIGRLLLRLLSPLFMQITKQFQASFAQRIEDYFKAHGGTLVRQAEVTGEQIREAVGAGVRVSTSGQ